MNKNIEYRSINKGTINGNKFEGYAIRTNCESLDLGGFTEVIEPKALEGIVERSDVYFLYLHDWDKPLARCNKGEGSLELRVDENGLFFSFEIPSSSWGNDLRSCIESGVIDSCSFGFLCKNDNFEKRSDGSYLRHINEIELLECSAVTLAAYPDTTIGLRSLDKYKEDELVRMNAYYESLYIK